MGTCFSFAMVCATAIGFLTILGMLLVVAYKRFRANPQNQTRLPSSSPFSSSPNWKHDVYPSIEGSDVSGSFHSHILKEFRSRGINPFIDSEIRRGYSIAPELVEAIRGSRIAIIVLSRNYASSSWCLNELVEIIKCREELGQLVAPIFCDLDPSDVKNQTGEFGELFSQTCKGKTKEDIARWRHALAEVAEIFGYYYSHHWDDEAAMIRIIATHISNILNISTASSNISSPFWEAQKMDSRRPNFVPDITSGVFTPSFRKMDSEEPNMVKEIPSDLSDKLDGSALSIHFESQLGRGAHLQWGKPKEPGNAPQRLRTSVDGDSSCVEDKSIDTCEVDAKADDFISRFRSKLKKQRINSIIRDNDRNQKLVSKEHLKLSTSSAQRHYTTPLYTSQRDFKGSSNRELHAVHIFCACTIQHSFASHLSMDFRRKGIAAFVNSNETMEVIEGASAFVVVFSKNYFPSTSCMDTLMKVLHCQGKNGQLVVPVFYGISPSDVVVLEHESEDWSMRLQEVRELPGHHSREECTECELVEEIVKDVCGKLFPMEHIGINSKLLELEKLICKQPWGIRSIGIWGMPGIGKTTLAKAFFDQTSGCYEASCFIKDFHRAFQEKGFHRLLEEHFGEILKELPRVCSSITRPSLPSYILSRKRTLVVLDDVHNPLAAKSFLEGFHWFGPGSLIIITSKDKNVFRQCHINHVYEVQSLNMNESLQLFSQSAFGKAIKEQNLLKLSKEVINYANGNPSSLSFYGRELKGKKLSEMETTFLKFKLRTPYRIHDLFKSSYESLDKRQKNIFMDIACFFNGENVDYVMQLLEGCGFSPLLGIDVLVENCLLTISESSIKMQRIIQDFGREIINGETVQIERRSRLWEPWTIKFLLEDDKLEANGYSKAICKRVLGTVLIEGIFLDTSNLLFDVKPTAFENMLNLRLLKIYSTSYTEHYGLRLPKGLESLPYELRLLHWENYPLQSLPQDFDPCHLVELNMPYSQLQKLWGGPKNLEMLKIVRLCHSQKLTEIDDICNAPNVKVIDLQGCTKLQTFPAMSHLQHLRVVNLSGCKEITSFPVISPNIEEIHLQGTGISELPVSIVTSSQQAKLNRELTNLLTQFSGVSDALNVEQLTSLVRASSSNQHLGKLVCLNIKDCFHLRSLPHMADLESLRVLNISGCSELEHIEGFSQNLKELYLGGTALKELPELPQSLEVLNAHGCLSLRSIRFGFKQLPRHCTLSNCFALSDQVVREYLKNALSYIECSAKEYQQELNKSQAFCFTVPSPARREVIFNLQPGYSVLVKLSPSWRSTLLGFAILVEAVFLEDYQNSTAFGFKCVCRWKDKQGHSHRIEKAFHCWTPGEDVQKFQKEHMFIFYDLTLHPITSTGKDPDILADLVVFNISPVDEHMDFVGQSCTVKSCGVYVITAENEDTSLTISQPVLSLDSSKMLSDDEVGDVLRGLDEKDRDIFLYFACLLNEEEADLVAPLFASIGLGISSAIEVLANNSLICASPFGIIVPQYLLGTTGHRLLGQRLLAQRLLAQRYLSKVSPIGNLRRHSDDFSDAGHFLTSCSLCERLLVPDCDIYMYRDTAFCSSECRQQQIAQYEKSLEDRESLEEVEDGEITHNFITKCWVYGSRVLQRRDAKSAH